MKLKKKLLSLICVGTLITSSVNPVMAWDGDTACAKEIAVDLDNMIVNDLSENLSANAIMLGEYGSQLSTIGQELYGMIYNDFKYYTSSEENSYDCPNGLRSADFNEFSKKLSSALVLDHPEIFWNADYKITATTNNGYVKSVKVQAVRYYTKTQIEDLEENLSSCVSSILLNYRQNYASKVKTDFDKVIWIHDYIVNNVKYMDKAAPNSNSFEQEATYPNQYNAYGALGPGTNFAVCKGYASAFKLLCDKLGVTCVTVLGTKTGSGHAWNYVKLNNKWYLVDTTLDDQLSSHYYFLTDNISGYAAFSDGMSSTYTPVSENAYIFGDVDGSGNITATDAATLNSDICLGETNNYTLFEFFIADVTGDDELTSNDCSYILQKSIDGSLKFPVEQ